MSGPAGELQGTQRQRSLLSYLLLPRPKDAVKWWLLPCTFALGAAAAGWSSSRPLRALAVWLVLELLVYQARYQWNDIRGFEADQRHPDAVARGRLPGPVELGRSRKSASASVMLLRLAGAVLIAVAVPGWHIVGLVLALIGAVFGVAVVYELLRDRATGRSGEVPPPLHPSLVAVWVVIGGGYAIRGVAGVGLAVSLGGRPVLVVAAVVTMWCYGIAFVTSRWVIEALAFARIRGGQLEWIARAEQAREHLLALTRWLPASGPPAHLTPRTWQPLREPTSLLAPWNLAAILSAAGAAVAGQQLAGHKGALTTVLAAVTGALLATYIVRPAAGSRLTALALGAAAFLVVLLMSGSHRPLLALAPWLIVLIAHIFFCGQSLATMGRVFRSALAARSPAPVVRDG